MIEPATTIKVKFAIQLKIMLGAILPIAQRAVSRKMAKTALI
jgi:hypothetical protein